MLATCCGRLVRTGIWTYALDLRSINAQRGAGREVVSKVLVIEEEGPTEISGEGISVQGWQVGR